MISTFSLHHWLHPTEYLKEIFRELKGGGEAWIYDGKKGYGKEKYGWFLSFIFQKVVRAHSSLTMKSAQEIISSPDIGFLGKKSGWKRDPP